MTTSQQQRMNELSKRELQAHITQLQKELFSAKEELDASLRTLNEIEKEKNLYRDISRSSGLEHLLDMLGTQIEAVRDIDGYLINLVDADHTCLICEKISLPQEFGGIQSTYLKYKFGFDKIEANVKAFEAKESVFINDNNIDDFPESKNRFERWKMFGSASVPVLYDETSSIGSVQIFSQTKDIPESSVKIVQGCLSFFCRQLKNSMRVAELEKMEASFKSAQEEQKKFLEFVERVNSLTKVDEVYDLFTKEMLRRYGFDLSGVVMLRSNRLVVQKCTIIDDKYTDLLNEWNEYYKEVSFALDPFEGATPTSFCQKTHLMIRDVKDIMDLPMSEKDRRALQILKNPRTFLFVPIVKDEEVVGILWLFSVSEPIAITENDLSVIKLLCRFLGAAIDNAQTYEIVEAQSDKISDLNASLEQKVIELNELATKDRLTGLFNFGYFQEELQRRIKEYQRCSGELFMSLVICDIDHFKSFNDTYGHNGGNIALKDVSSRIAKQARDMDVVCRYGGEEFVVILPKCDLEGARVFAERIRVAVEQEPVETDADAVPVTISMGCASYKPNETMTEFINRADEALYSAKELGRNRVEVAEE
ncbi:MAG: sensor domain-containing diguanylate cyclase [Gammaproteobacteria bacterium]|nr:MAG: sensor domain-containing diguanylate cyclase [Gammaproteobacteria bacterium]